MSQNGDKGGAIKVRKKHMNGCLCWREETEAKKDKEKNKKQIQINP